MCFCYQTVKCQFIEFIRFRQCFSRKARKPKTQMSLYLPVRTWTCLSAIWQFLNSMITQIVRVFRTIVMFINNINQISILSFFWFGQLFNNQPIEVSSRKPNYSIHTNPTRETNWLWKGTWQQWMIKYALTYQVFIKNATKQLFVLFKSKNPYLSYV